MEAHFSSSFIKLEQINKIGMNYLKLKTS